MKALPRAVALIAADLQRLAQELATADYVARGKKAARSRVRSAAARKANATRRSRVVKQ
jgi:hypothetical protein